MASVRISKNSGNGKIPNGSNNDEIEQFVSSCFITASEAMWRIYGFDVHGRDPAIQHLAIHEEDQQSVTFDEHNPHEALTKKKNTTLL